MAANLTDRALRAMKPNADGSQRELFDADARGLSARCSTSGGCRCCFTYTSPVTNKRRRQTIGTYPAGRWLMRALKASTLRRTVEGRPRPDRRGERPRRGG